MSQLHWRIRALAFFTLLGACSSEDSERSGNDDAAEGDARNDTASGDVANDATADSAADTPTTDTQADPSTDAQSDTPEADGGADPSTEDASELDGWLYTEGNHIYTSVGEVWHARGANLHDTRGCDACSWIEPNPSEVMRRADALFDDWGANLARLLLENYSDDGGFRIGWQNVLDDPEYLADVQDIIAHITSKPDAWVLLSLWIEPTVSDLGWPTEATIPIWEELARTFAHEPRVLFGLINEPQYNFDGAEDEGCWTAMNETVAAIRAVEDELGTPHHIIAVQGTGGWSRRLDYYVDHPITAGGGDNIAYEIHIYNPEADFEDMLTGPAATLPVIIGEYGPADTFMTMEDAEALGELARSLEVPHLAWTFHHRCPPNLIVDYSEGGCGVAMDLEPTEWGVALQGILGAEW